MAELKDLSSVVLSATEDRGPAAVVLMLTEHVFTSWKSLQLEGLCVEDLLYIKSFLL